jgi:predicted RNA-binding protein associated with RNAse of E/G family
VPAVSANAGRSQVFNIDKDELEAALRADQVN